MRFGGGGHGVHCPTGQIGQRVHDVILVPEGDGVSDKDEKIEHRRDSEKRHN